jgi:hypothetical protein
MTLSPDSVAFCWRPLWFNRFESLWNLLRKFAHVNGATTKNLQDHLSAGEPARYAWATSKRVDLRQYGGFDATLIAGLLRIDHTLMDESTVLPFLAAEERDTLASRHLRFCTSCLREGFHSSIHQILLITECPLHLERLRENCPWCGIAIDYVLRTAAFGSAVRCNRCLHPSMRWEIRQRLTLSSRKREEKFGDAAHWLRHRLEVRADEYGPKWIEAKRSTAGRQLRISQLSAYWKAVLTSGTGPAAATAGTAHSHFDWIDPEYAQAQTRDRGNVSAQQRQLNNELLKILKAIRRQLNKLWLRPHRKCVTYLLRHERSTAHFERGTPCPYANVLILWRLYWEQFDDLFYLERRPSRLHHGLEAPLRVRHFDRPLPKALIHRVFVLECLAVLEECYLLVKTLRRSNQHTFLPAFVEDVSGRSMPYWIVERRTGGLFRLHVWRQTDRSRWQAITFPAVPNPTKRGAECDNSPSRMFERTARMRRPFAMKAGP